MLLLHVSVVKENLEDVLLLRVCARCAVYSDFYSGGCGTGSPGVFLRQSENATQH